uniref:Clan AA aspartic protease n=1 Tax=Thermofilum pendens TaxID=2269 RepID=A0A7C3WUU4_THEPE
MGIRVRVRLLVEGREVEAVALVNSGFESRDPDICVPLGLAKVLGLWPPASFESEEAMTAGGEVPLFRLPARAEVQLLAGGEVKSRSPCSVVVNPYVDEVLLSDYLIDELGIVPVSFRRGLWRHRSDPEGIVRESEEPRYWR